MSSCREITLVLGRVPWMNHEELRHWLLNIIARAGIRVRIINQGHAGNIEGPVVHYSCDQPDLSGQQAIWMPAPRELSARLVKHAGAGWIWAADCKGVDDPLAGAIDLLTLEFERREYNNLRLDSFGRIPSDWERPWSDKLVPLVEMCAEAFRMQVEESLQLEIERVEPWGEHKAVVVLTHDVDGPSLFSAFPLARSVFLGLFRGNAGEAVALRHAVFALLGERHDPYWNFDAWQALATRLGARSTLFLYPGPASGVKRHPRDPHYDPNSRAWRGRLGAGSLENFEVGLHKSINSHDIESLSSERTLLESRFGVQVDQHRAHYWSYDWKSTPEFWSKLHAAGFRIDMSMSPMTTGYRNATGVPFSTPEGLLVFPSLGMDAYLDDSIRSLESDQVSGFVDRILGDAVSYRQCIVLDWHVRSAFNAGPYKEYLYALFLLLARVNESGEIKVVSSSEAADSWSAHMREIDLTEHGT